MLAQLKQLYFCLVTGYPRLTLSAIAILTLALIAGLPNFKLDASSDSLTLEHDADLDYFREVSKRYQAGDFLIITYRPNAPLFSDEGLATLQKLTAELATLDGVKAINSVLNVPLLYSPKLSLTEVAGTPRTLMSPGTDRQQAIKEFQTSPIYKNLILSDDAQTTLIQLDLEVDNRFISLVQQRDALRLKASRQPLTEAEQRELEQVSKTFLDYRTAAAARSHQRVAAVRAIAERYRDKAQIYLGGVSMITADMISFIQSDLIVFGIAILLFMIIVLALIFRKTSYVVIAMTTCITAVLIMLGYVSWLDWRLTVISSNFVALLLIISLAIIIHLLVRYREYQREHSDWTQEQLVSATVKFMAKPCLYTVLTTMVAFASLVFSDIRPVIDFGWMMVLGLMVAFALAFLLMPACLMLFAKKKQQLEIPESDRPYTYFLARAVDGHRVAIWMGAILIAVLAGIGVTRLQVENRFIDYFHESTEIYQGLSVIDELTGTTTLDIVIQAPAPEQNSGSEDDPFASDPFGMDDGFAADDSFAQSSTAGPGFWMTQAGLRQIEELHQYLENQAEVGKVQSLATLYRVGSDINGGLNDFELALLNRSLPEEVRQVLVDPYLAKDGDETRISLRIKDTYPNLQRAALVERFRAYIDQSDTFDADNVRFTGLLVLYNNMLQSLFGSQIMTLGIVFFAITLMFIILFRSVVIALTGMLPNVLAAFSILGFMGLIGLPLDMMTITVAAISVGIGVDNTIHYIYRFREELQHNNGDYRQAMYQSHSSIGRALFYTSVIIIFGFSIMVLSKFIPTIYFGLLTGLAMFAAVMGSLLLLPALLLWVKPFKSRF